MSLAKLALSESVNESQSTGEITPDSILSAVCGYYKYKREDLLGKARKPTSSKRGRSPLTSCANAHIAPHFHRQYHGRRDHTTIMYSRDKVDELIKLNERMRKKWTILKTSS